IGLWHGFTLNFLAFGVFHAILLSATVLILARRKRAAAKKKTLAESDWLRPRAAGFLGAVLTFALVSLSMIFVHSWTWGEAVSIFGQVLGATPSGATGWSDMPATLTVPAWICMGIALYLGAGAPGAGTLGQGMGKIAPDWLQYGVCLFLLTVLSSAGSGHFIYGQF